MAIRCMFVGFTKGVKGYILWYPTDKRCINSKDVVFREYKMFVYQVVQQPDLKEMEKSTIEVELSLIV